LSRLSCVLPALFVAASAALCGCSTSLATRVPHGIDLAGEWEIDLPLSDFPADAVPALDVVAGTPVGDAGPGQGGGQGGQGGRGGRGGRGMGGGGMPPTAGAAGVGPGGGLLHHFARPPRLSISQNPSAVTINVTMPDGKLVTHVYAFGEHSVVTTTRGPANRTVGWDGDDLLIRTQVGGDKGTLSEVRYSLDRDGTLSVIATFSNSGIYNFQYTLEYDPLRQ
jgi:hypothetical protein